MAVCRKLMRNGNGWALCINSTILGFLDVDPEEDFVMYTIEKNKLIISKHNAKNGEVSKKTNVKTK